MKSEEGTPIKPLTPFFLFKEKQAEKGKKLGGKEAGDLWASLSAEEKDVYIKEYKEKKQRFDEYLEKTEGILPRPRKISYKDKASPMSVGKADHFRTKRIRIVLGSEPNVLPLDKKLQKALGKVLVFKPI